MQTIQADEAEGHGSADIHISPDGRYLYASHRLKNDGISIFQIADDGHLRKIGYHPTGIHPRNFAITPNGKYLLVACRDSNRVEIYQRNPVTGTLTPTGKQIPMSQPTCIQFTNK